MTDEPNLKAAYGLQTPEDNRRLYADWAETYDKSFAAEHRYVSPQMVTDAFVAAGGQGPVLDIGAGTGLCAQALVALGLSDVDGTDISPEMLEVAARKRIYRQVFAGDILAGLDVEDGAYRGIVSSGTFTNGHVGPQALGEVVRLLAHGGLAVLSVNAQHFAAKGFDAELRRLEPDLAEIYQTTTRLYAEGATGPHADDEGVLVHLRAK